MAWIDYNRRRSKYGAHKVQYKDMEFDSQREFARYCELHLLEKHGDIAGLQRQVKFVLIPKQVGEDGKVLERECSYIADYVYTDLRIGLQVVEDVKGMKTKDYVIKRKLMLYRYGIRIHEI